MTVCAYLIIKAHSARVPGKNFRLLGDRPLFRWVLDALSATSEVGRIVINTDARERLEAVGLPPGVEILDRPAVLCGDEVTANTLIAADLERLGDHILMTHATSPFLRPDTLSAAIKAYRDALSDRRGDSVFGVTRHQTRFWRANGEAINHDPAHLVPTQTLEPWLEENSSLYVFSAASFAAKGARIGVQPVPFETPRLDAVDIDTEIDWELARTLARGLLSAPSP